MPSGQYIRTPEIIELTRKNNKILWDTRREELCRKISLATKGKGRIPWNKKPPTVCRGCGVEFPYKHYANGGGKYCTRKCYLKNDNPFNDPDIKIKILANLPKGDDNPSKRPEVRAKISKALKGRDAYWMRGRKASPETSAKISEALKIRWRNKKWAARHLIVMRDNGVFGKSVESFAHSDMKVTVGFIFIRNDYDILMEHPVLVGDKWYIVDVVGFNNNRQIAVECGDCKVAKLDALEQIFDKVVHIPYGLKIKEEELICQ